MPRDEQFESRVSTYREKQRLLVVKSLPFRASIADIKKACREKLTKPETARFFWSQPEDSKNKHPGWCMVGFDFRGDFRQAQQDLQGLEIRGRPIRMEKAKRFGFNLPAVPAAPAAALAPAPAPAPAPALSVPALPAAVALTPAPVPAPALASPAPKSNTNCEVPNQALDDSDYELVNYSD